MEFGALSLASFTYASHTLAIRVCAMSGRAQRFWPQLRKTRVKICFGKRTSCWLIFNLVQCIIIYRSDFSVTYTFFICHSANWGLGKIGILIWPEEYLGETEILISPRAIRDRPVLSRTHTHARTHTHTHMQVNISGKREFGKLPKNYCDENRFI